MKLKSSIAFAWAFAALTLAHAAPREGVGVGVDAAGLSRMGPGSAGASFLGQPVASAVYLVNARGDLLFPTGPEETATGWRWKTPGGFVEMATERRGEDLALALRGEGRNLRAIGFKFRVKRGIEILVPGGRNGLSLRAQDLPREERFTWPRRWEAPVIVGEGEKGSFAAWYEDPSNRYKSVILATNAGELMVSFEVENHAPFEGRDSIVAPPLYLRAFETGYQQALAPFSKWMQARYLAGMPPLSSFKSAPVQALVLLPSLRDGKQAEINRRLAENLARELDPRKTLLWTVTWYDDESYGRKPDLPTPMEGFAAMNEAAHRLGFINFSYLSSYAAITKSSRVFAECEPWLFNDEKTGRPLFYEGDRVPHYMASGLAPALQRAHALTISNMVKKLGVDVVSLEQTSATWNSAGAWRDGKSGVDGIEDLHRAVLRGAPGAELAAEGMADLLLPFDRFHQTHVWQAIYEPAKQVAFPLLRRAHPISSYLFYPHSRKIAFLDIVAPTSAFYWEDLKPAFIRWGVLPSLRFEGNQSLRRLGMRVSMEEARVWQRVSGALRFAAKISDAVALDLVGKDASARYEMDGKGSIDFTETQPGKEPRLVYGLVKGRREKEIPAGAIPQWPAQSGTRAVGLDPDAWYLAMGAAAPADLCGVVSRVPEGGFIQRHYLRGRSAVVFMGGAMGEGVAVEGIGEGSLHADGLSASPLRRGPNPTGAKRWLALLASGNEPPVLDGPRSTRDLLFSSHAVMGRSGMIDPPASEVEKEDLAAHPPCDFRGRTEEGLWLVPVNFGACRALLLWRTARGGTLRWNPVLCLAREQNLTGVAWKLRLDGEILGNGRKASAGYEDLPVVERALAPGLHALEIEVDALGRWDGDMAFIGGRLELAAAR